MVLSPNDINNLIQPFLAFVNNPDFYRLPHNRGEELKDTEIEQLYDFAYSQMLLSPENESFENLISLTDTTNILEQLAEKGDIFRRPIKTYRYRGEKASKNRRRHVFSPALSDRDLRKLINRGIVVEELDTAYVAKEMFVLTTEEMLEMKDKFAVFMRDLRLGNPIEKAPTFNGTPIGEMQITQMINFFIEKGWRLRLLEN